MTRNSRTIVTALAVILGRVSDTGSTLHFNFSDTASALSLNSPLSNEGSPIISITGNGARTLVLTNILAVLVLLFLPLWLYWRYPVQTCSATPANLREFISLQFYKRILPKREFFRAFWFKLPKDWLQTGRLFGFVVCWSAVGGSFMATFNWWALWGWNWRAYEEFRDRLLVWGYPVLEPLAALVFGLIAGYIFFKTEFADYKSQNDTVR